MQLSRSLNRFFSRRGKVEKNPKSCHAFFAFFTVPEKNLYTFTPMFATFFAAKNATMVFNKFFC